MKKSIIILMTVLAITAFTACGSNEAETVTENSVSETTAAEVTEKAVETKAETEAETSSETVTETEAEIVSETEAAAETEKASEAADKSETIKGTAYTLTIDSEKWYDISEYMTLIAGIAENSELAKDFEITAEDFEDSGNLVYYHAENGSNFNIVEQDIGADLSSDEMLEMMGAVMQEQLNSVDGYNCESYKIVEVNGYKALKMESSVTDPTFGNIPYKQCCFMFFNNTNQVAVTCTTDESGYEEALAEFEKVINTIELK